METHIYDEKNGLSYTLHLVKYRSILIATY